MLSGFTQDFAGAFVARLFLGVVEAGFFPAAMLVVALWYSRAEVQKRVAAFYATGILTGSFSMCAFITLTPQPV
jgi:MFS family permease